MDVFSDSNRGEDHLLPSLDLPTFSKLRIPSGRRSSMRLPSLGSIIESEQESQSFDSTDSAFEESSQFTSGRSSTLDGADSNISSLNKTIILEEEEEKEIERKVKQEFKQEFRNIKAQTKEKQKMLRKKFKSKINAARSKLLLARAHAEKETIEKLTEEAERREAAIINQRKKRRNSTIAKTTELYTPEEMAALRKVRSELDRARARRRSTIATSLVISRHKSMKTAPGLLPDFEIKRMEKEDEIQRIVEELKNLGLDDAAKNLTASLKNKMSSEEQLVQDLKQERQQAKLKAMVKKNMAVEKLRKIKIEEKEILERERVKREAEERERLERERRIRVMNALKRKAFNIDLRNSLVHAKLTTKVSRAYTYSYFNTQQP